LKLIVHRSTQEIGGNCIELESSSGARLLLDIGRPLGAPRQAKGLLPETLDTGRDVAGVVISHPHQDHWGLLDETPAHWPVWSGAHARKLIDITASIFGEVPRNPWTEWSGPEPFDIGPFRLTPFLTDHSVFDAYGLLIEADGRRVFYSGDFRRHGRKAVLVNRLMALPPADIAVLLMEGTNVGTDKPTRTESDIEGDFVDLMKATRGRVFVNWSAQNVDRTVTLYRACLQAGRTLVVDLYTAEVLEALADAGKLPAPGWNNIKVVITRAFSRLYKAKGRDTFVDRMASHGMSARALTTTPDRWVIMLRKSLIGDYSRAGVNPSPDDAWSWSQWSGYLKEPEGQVIADWLSGGGAKACHLHTSGHASTADLVAFAAALKPKTLVPIHGVAWDNPPEGLPPITRLVDGQTLEIA
jgi:ribonuclease J